MTPRVHLPDVVFDTPQSRTALQCPAHFALFGILETTHGRVIRRKILALLDQHPVATLRPDGWPQATTVRYVNEGLTLYFLCGLDIQKAKTLARDKRISLTIDHDTADLMTITGLSMAAHAHAVGPKRARSCACSRGSTLRRLLWR